MTKAVTPKNANSATTTTPTKHQQVLAPLTRDDGATLQELSTTANWLPHSTRTFLTGLKKRGYGITSEMIDSVRRYRISSLQSNTEAK